MHINDSNQDRQLNVFFEAVLGVHRDKDQERQEIFAQISISREKLTLTDNYFCLQPDKPKLIFC